MTTDRISRLEGTYEQVDKRLGDLQQSVVTLRGDINVLRNEMNTRFDSIESRMNSRFDSMESQTNSRFDSMESRFNGMESQTNSRFDSMESRFNGMESRFNNIESRINQLFILLGVSWVTIIAAVIGIALGTN